MKRNLCFSLLLIFSFCIYGQKFPNFSLVSINGDTISNDILKGKLVYINVFETYCAPCISELPVLHNLMKKYPDVLFIAITPAKKEKVITFLEKHPINFLVIPEAQVLCKKLYVACYPSHFIIDKSGNFHDYSVPEGFIINDNDTKEDMERNSNEKVYKKFDELLTNFEK